MDGGYIQLKELRSRLNKISRREEFTRMNQLEKIITGKLL